MMHTLATTFSTNKTIKSLKCEHRPWYDPRCCNTQSYPTAGHSEWQLVTSVMRDARCNIVMFVMVIERFKALPLIEKASVGVHYSSPHKTLLSGRHTHTELYKLTQRPVTVIPVIGQQTAALVVSGLRYTQHYSTHSTCTQLTTTARHHQTPNNGLTSGHTDITLPQHTARGPADLLALYLPHLHTPAPRAVSTLHIYCKYRAPDPMRLIQSIHLF